MNDTKPYLICLDTSGERLVVTYSSNTKSGFQEEQFSRDDTKAAMLFFNSKFEDFMMHGRVRAVVLGDEELLSKDQAAKDWDKIERYMNTLNFRGLKEFGHTINTLVRAEILKK